MFELELLELLNKLKKTDDEYELKKIKNSITNLIKDHQNEFEMFIQSNALDSNTLKLLKECQQISDHEDDNEKEPEKKKEKSDFEIIRDQFRIWLEIYNKNNKQLTDENTKIIKDIINFYAQNRYEVIEQILKIEDNEDFEAFKWHIKNNLRAYFGQKILNFMKTPEFEKLSFIRRKRKEARLKQLMNKLTQYDIDKLEIEEVLK